MSDFPEGERPRERLEKRGAEALTDAELLAVILKTGTSGENVLDLARRILALTGEDGIGGLRNLSLNNLTSIKGVGKAKALQIAAACELATRINTDKCLEIRMQASNSYELGNLLLQRQRWYDKENFEVVLLDSRKQIIRISRLTVGTVDSSVVHPRDVFSEAVKNCCTSIVLSHNHPSGVVTPSDNDIRTTDRIIGAGNVLGIEVEDHIITGRDCYYSMRDNGDLAKMKSKNSLIR